MAGFTTIRSLGWFREAYELDVKRAIDEGYISGSRMIVSSHFLCTTGSHGDMTQVVRNNPYLSDYMMTQYPTCGDGPDFFTSAVRREKKMGADFLKIMATGGFATPNDDPEDIQLNDEEFKAIFDTAKEVKISVTAHAYGPKLMKKLIGYGITGVVHGSLMDSETAKCSKRPELISYQLSCRMKMQYIPIRKAWLKRAPNTGENLEYTKINS